MTGVLAVVQARLGSKRFPKKVLRPIAGQPAISWTLSCLEQSNSVASIILATTLDHVDDELESYVLENHPGVAVFRGDEKDVLGRFHNAVEGSDADLILRVTGDCPFVCDDLLAELAELRQLNSAHYASNTLAPSYPDGLDLELFRRDLLEQAFEHAETAFDREHVTPWMKRQTDFTISSLEQHDDYSNFRLTLDYRSDLEILNRVATELGGPRGVTWKRIRQILDTLGEELRNSQAERDEGSRMSLSQKMYQRAKNVIPGGTHLFSKLPENFLPEHWPNYFKRAKGTSVEDYEGNTYLDFSMSGIGTNILGYAHDEVDAKVMDAVASGTMSTLNNFEEVLLAERLLDMHPWAGGARFARTGGEANAVALRIARAAAGRTKVLICGYHGWHDWYLASNLHQEDRLSSHLLSGLSTKGVPSSLRDTIDTFEYNNLEDFRSKFDDSVGVVFMEVSRNYDPLPGFLEGIRESCSDRGAVLIFDECTSGFRQTFGGYHKLTHIEPDVAVFGKALANGIPMTAVIGEKGIMDHAKDSFISSTFWSDRLGPVAALATLDVMEQVRSWELITNIGMKIRNAWLEIASQFGLEVSVSGLAALNSFVFGENHLIKKTFVTQEMLKRGYLASTNVYANIAMTPTLLDSYINNLGEVLLSLSHHDDTQLASRLEGPVVHSGFRRMN